MKLPADGSARVNSATVVARKRTAIPAATIVNGAAMPAVTAITPEGEVEIDLRPDIGHRGDGQVPRAELAGLKPPGAGGHGHDCSRPGRESQVSYKALEGLPL
jgi:hypothetical protein